MWSDRVSEIEWWRERCRAMEIKKLIEMDDILLLSYGVMRRFFVYSFMLLCIIFCYLALPFTISYASPSAFLRLQNKGVWL